MAVYVISDIHGEYDMLIDLLSKIQLKDSDTLYILGDILDRGPHPIKVLLKLMNMPNVICMVGNHELMAAECLGFFTQKITEETIADLNEEMLDNLILWQQYNGGDTTINEFRALSPDMRQEVMDFIGDFEVYEEIAVAGKKYLLVHGGLGGFSPEKDIEDYSLKELIWDRAEYDRQYYPDVYVVTGHTPTQTIKENPRPGYIYREKNHIALDCGCHIKGGRLAAICLDTGKEFYSERTEAAE